MSPRLQIREDDLSGADVRALLALHLAGMRETTPPGHVFALDLSGLSVPEVTVFTAWRDGALAGIGALKALGDGGGEIKSMRTHPDHLRRGVGEAILVHIIAEARRRGFSSLSLETGRGPAFDAALALYAKHGFRPCGAFADYAASDFNQFRRLTL
jgi:putative acetyltransferase